METEPRFGDNLALSFFFSFPFFFFCSFFIIGPRFSILCLLFLTCCSRLDACISHVPHVLVSMHRHTLIWSPCAALSGLHALRSLLSGLTGTVKLYSRFAILFFPAHEPSSSPSYPYPYRTIIPRTYPSLLPPLGPFSVFFILIVSYAKYCST